MKGSFSRSAVVLLVAAGIALFALSVLLHAYDNDPVATGGRARPGSYSTSAIGHAGFYDTLRRLGFTVSRSVGNTLATVGSHGTLVVAEPDLNRVSSADGRKLLSAPRLLLVLPKWSGAQDKGRPAWISEVAPAQLGYVRGTLQLVSGRSDVYRDTWPRIWNTNEIGINPTDPGTGVIQLIRSQELRPVVGTGEGMLVGELVNRNRTIWVLADPDVMSNHGIGKGDNIRFMLTLMDALRMTKNADPGAPVVFDETVHGFQEAQGSPIRLLFRFPFVVVTILTVAAGTLLALAGMSRFGAPLPPEPNLDFGKKALIGNGARLLDYAGHHAVVLKRYVLMVVRSTARTLHAPQGMDAPSLAAWLDRVGRARGVTKPCSTILRGVAGINDKETRNLPRLFACARDIYRWKGEILNGPAASDRRRQ